MAIVKRGSMLEGLRGRVGDMVFREVGGQTVVSRRPSGRREDVRSPQRERALTRFQQAVLFAREARHRHSYRSLSRVLRAHSPYHVALQDYLSEPVIERIDTAAVGPRGGELIIEVSERVAVRSVRVKLAARAAATGERPTPAVEGSSRPPEGMPATQGQVPPGSPPPMPTAGDAERREPIPAALFFRRVQRPGATAAATPTGAPSSPPARPPVSTAEAGQPGGPAILPLPASASRAPELPREPAPPAVDPGPMEIHATRHLGIQQKADRPDRRIGEEPHVETWRVILPRPGEIEIIATDYAGNRAVRSVRAGLPAAGPDGQGGHGDGK